MTEPDRDHSTSRPRIALVTGASRGLGAALAERLAPAFHVVAVGRTVGALEELDDRITAKGGHATLAPMDVTVPAAMATLCRGIHDRWGHVDLWCHTAVHAAPLTPAGHVQDRDWDRSVSTNLTATRVLIGMVEPLLLAAPDGTAAFFDDPRAGEKFFGAYGSTKAGQIALARSWAAETVKIGPRIRVLTPPPMPTAVRARFFPGEDRAPLTSCAAAAAALVEELDLCALSRGTGR